MVLETKADADLALLRRLRARRSEKENAFESPKLRAPLPPAGRSPLTSTPAAAVSASASASARLAGRSGEKERGALPSSVNTQRLSAPASALPTRAAAVGLVQPMERVAAARGSDRAPEPKKQERKSQQLALVPERIFECVLDDDGNVTTRCFIKGKFLGKVCAAAVHSMAATCNRKLMGGDGFRAASRAAMR